MGRIYDKTVDKVTGGYAMFDKDNDNMFDTIVAGRIPMGLPGGFFIYEAEGNERIVFAEPNVIKLYGCDTFEEFLDLTNGSFQGMVHPGDLYKIQNQKIKMEFG